METIYDRTARVLGEAGVEQLKKSKVIVFGVGGVGGSAVEALTRAGIGTIDIVDKDVVDITNVNRQIIALHSTIGKSKVTVMEERMKDINPDVCVTGYQCFYLPDTKDTFDLSNYDYVVDAVDTVTAKLLIIEEAKQAKTPVISCMGAGNKVHPELFEIADVSRTSVCPLAKVMRKELKERGISNVKVVYSKEQPAPVTDRVTGSVSFVPGVAGMIMAGEVIRELLQLK